MPSHLCCWNMRRITNRERAPDTSFFNTRINVPRYCCKGETQVVYISSLSIQILKSNVFIAGNCVSNRGMSAERDLAPAYFLGRRTPADVHQCMSLSVAVTSRPCSSVTLVRRVLLQKQIHYKPRPHEVRPLRNTPLLAIWHVWSTLPTKHAHIFVQGFGGRGSWQVGQMRTKSKCC